MSPDRTPTIGVYFDGPAYDDYPFDDPYYVEAYRQLARMLAEKGARSVIIRGMATYAGGNEFRGGWEWDPGTDAFRRTERLIRTGTIYDKGQRLSVDEAATVVNPRAFDRLCTDKWETYQRFREHFPVSVRVDGLPDLSAARELLSGDMLVAKPLDEERGHGVIVGEREEVLSSVRVFPYLVQEMIDTRGGVPGLTEGVHDLRVISVAGRMITAYVRMPPPGSFVANVSGGGSWFGIPIKDLPAGASALFEAVDGALAEFPERVYSTDMGLHRDGSWKLFELNAKPALSALGSHEGAEEFMARLADVLIASAAASPRS